MKDVIQDDPLKSNPSSVINLQAPFSSDFPNQPRPLSLAEHPLTGWHDVVEPYHNVPSVKLRPAGASDILHRHMESLIAYNFLKVLL
jgi:hypothetical protein